MGTLKRLKLVTELIAKETCKKKNNKIKVLFIEYPEPQNLQNFPESEIAYSSTLRNRVDLAEKHKLVVCRAGSKLYDAVVVTISKSREESKILIARGFSQLDPNGILIIEGEKKDGIDGTLRLAGKKIPVSTVVSIAHGKFGLFKVGLALKKNIFDDWLALKLPKPNADEFVTAPGLFSYKKVDEGSLFLGKSFQGKLSGHVVDLGAGWGFLSDYALKTNCTIKSITLIENNKAALEMAKLNVKSSNARFFWSDVSCASELGEKYDAVICNPPFHNGKKVDFGLAFSFVSAASRLLRKNGLLWLVANIHLPYECHIKKCFFQSDILAENGVFKIILAKGPKLD